MSADTIDIHRAAYRKGAEDCARLGAAAGLVVEVDGDGMPSLIFGPTESEAWCAWAREKFGPTMQRSDDATLRAAIDGLLEDDR